MSKAQNETGRAMTPTHYLWAAALAALIGFGAVYLTARTSDNGNTVVAGEAGIGAAPAEAPTAASSGSEMAAFVTRKAPEPLPAFTFQDGEGRPLTIADFKGRTVLLNLWATWCGPCRLEMPALDRLQAAMGSDKFEVVALSLDKGGVEKARKFLDDIKVTRLKFYIDPTGKEGFNLLPQGLPTTLLIDAEGREIGRLTGPAEWDSEAAKALIAGYLK